MPQTMRSLIDNYVIEIKKIYGNYLSRIILYGSYARGDFGPDSDVDIMILLDMSDLELKKYSKQLSYVTYDFNLDNNIDINPIAKSEAHFRKWMVNYPFYANIQKEGVVLYGKSYKRHKDAISNFNKEYVKTGIFPREMGRKIGEAEEIRHASDYDDFYVASCEETERQIVVADEFIQLVEKYCMMQLEEKMR